MTKTKFKVGDRVFRENFGKGKVVEVEFDLASDLKQNVHVKWDKNKKFIDNLNFAENLEFLGKENFDELNLSSQIVDRKDYPVFSGVLKYFPDAIMEVAHVSKIGNDQHNPGEPLHWDRSKSTDEGDALARHLIDAGKIDTDGTRHTAKLAWRALAILQKEIENDRK
jgi:hypothetical protein